MINKTSLKVNERVRKMRSAGTRAKERSAINDLVFFFWI
jgi:hypothetical protein